MRRETAIATLRLDAGASMLASTVAWLRDNGYHVLIVDASWLITSHMFRDLGNAFGSLCQDQWPCLGESLDDALADTWERSAGFALALSGFDQFVGHQVDDAHTPLEIIT